jgi:hypothetical protein
VALVLLVGWPSHPFGVAKGSLALRVFRIFRISRVARVGRFLKMMPELLLLVKGMTIAIRSVFATLILLAMAIYVFAIVFRELLTGTQVGEDNFSSVPASMNFLLQQVVCGFDIDVAKSMLEAGWPFYVLFMLYAFLGSFTIMNMLIGVICQVVTDVADIEAEHTVLTNLRAALAQIDKELDLTDHLPADRFLRFMSDEKLMSDLRDSGVDMDTFINEVANAYRDNDIPSKKMLHDMMSGYRNSKNVTTKDLINLRLFFSDSLAALQVRLCRDMNIEMVKTDGASIKVQAVGHTVKRASTSTIP